MIDSAGGARTATISCSIKNVTNGVQNGWNISGHGLACRLYAPAYTFNPLRLEDYLKQGQKRIQYTDIFSYQCLNVPVGPFNYLITNGIANLKKVIIVPFIAQSEHGKCAEIAAAHLPAIGNGFSTMASPFASEPATTSPLPGALYQLNIRIGGVNAVQNNINYGYEMFLNELYGIGAINGGTTTGLTSGLINQKMWQNNYQYYVFDVSRRLKEEDRVSKSIEIIGTNNSVLNLDLFVFAELEREMVIDLTTGARLA